MAEVRRRIAPLVSGVYAWTYLAAGGTDRAWTAIPVLLQFAGLLALLHAFFDHVLLRRDVRVDRVFAADGLLRLVRVDGGGHRRAGGSPPVTDVEAHADTDNALAGFYAAFVIVALTAYLAHSAWLPHGQAHDAATCRRLLADHPGLARGDTFLPGHLAELAVGLRERLLCLRHGLLR